MSCLVCDGTGWVRAYPVVQRVTSEGEKAVVAEEYALVPCFAHGGVPLAVPE